VAQSARGLIGWWERSASDARDEAASLSRAGRATAILMQQCREPSFWDAVRMTSDRNGGGNAEAPPHVLLAYGLPAGGSLPVREASPRAVRLSKYQGGHWWSPPPGAGIPMPDVSLW
jgi:hypothetical protein